MSSTLNDLLRQSLAALRLLVVFTLLLGVVYPLGLWAVGRAFGDRAEGEPLRFDGEVVGSRLLGQQFDGDSWFHARPSANDYDPLASASGNGGPSSKELLTDIDTRRRAVAESERVDPDKVPADALTGSGSGLDPHISRAYAQLQAPRVAHARGIGLTQVRRLIVTHTDGRSLGFLGEPGVNIVELNLAVQRAAGA